MVWITLDSSEVLANSGRVLAWVCERFVAFAGSSGRACGDTCENRSSISGLVQLRYILRRMQGNICTHVGSTESGTSRPKGAMRTSTT